MLMNCSHEKKHKDVAIYTFVNCSKHMFSDHCGICQVNCEKAAK